MKGAVNELTLGGGNLLITFRRPVFQRVGIFTHYSFARAGGVEQNGIKAFGQRGAEDAPVEVGEGNVINAAAADIGVQHFHPAGRKFVGQDRSVVAHPGGYLCGLGTRRSGDVHHSLGHFTIGEQRRHRQHRARFLNIK